MLLAVVGLAVLVGISSAAPAFDLANATAELEAFETQFSTEYYIKYADDHVEIPIFSVAAYVVMVFYVPGLLPEKFNPTYMSIMRKVWAMWNLLLSVFSIIGVSRTVPYLIRSVYDYGFVFTLCEHPTRWWGAEGNATGTWITLFIFSKFPELLDTVFLVLLKKPVIFLHWFHHLTVLLYCWHALANWTACGIWFASMNFSVHSIMYGYYFFQIMGFKAVSVFAPLITTVQLVQMIAGMAITYLTAAQHWSGVPWTSVGALGASNERKAMCSIHPANYKMGLAMYTSYFVLFAVLFYNLYVDPKGKHAKSRSKSDSKKSMTRSASSSAVCGVEDGAGFFHPKTQSGTVPVAEKRD